MAPADAVFASAGVVERSIPARLVANKEFKVFYRKVPRGAEWDRHRGCFGLRPGPPANAEVAFAGVV